MELLGTVTLRGLDQAVQKALSEAKANAVSLVLEGLPDQVAEQFLTAGAAYGTPWPPRHPDRTPGRPLLVLTGRLLGSLINTRDPEHVGIIESDGTGTFGTRVPYAGFLNFGTRRMPARPILTEAMLQGIKAKL